MFVRLSVHDRVRRGGRQLGALCRQPGATQASQADPGKGRRILGGFGWVEIGSGGSPQHSLAVREPRYTYRIDLTLRKPLEDVQFIIQYSCAAVSGPQTPLNTTNPVAR